MAKCAPKAFIFFSFKRSALKSTTNFYSQNTCYFQTAVRLPKAWSVRTFALHCLLSFKQVVSNGRRFFTWKPSTWRLGFRFCVTVCSQNDSCSVREPQEHTDFLVLLAKLQRTGEALPSDPVQSGRSSWPRGSALSDLWPLPCWHGSTGNLTHEQRVWRQRQASNANLHNRYQLKSDQNNQEVLTLQIKTATDDGETQSEDITGVVKNS